VTVEAFRAKESIPALAFTLGELVEADAALTRLLEVRLSAQLAYNVAKLAKIVKKETTHYHERRDALIRELGEPVPGDPNGAIRVAPANMAAFVPRLQELMAVTATLTVTPLRLADLPEMTGADLVRLGVLVTD